MLGESGMCKLELGKKGGGGDDGRMVNLHLGLEYQWTNSLAVIRLMFILGSYMANASWLLSPSSP